jgi:putative two-component system response regulator
MTRVNRAMCAMTGYDADDLVGMHFADITHEDDRAGDAEPFAALIDGRLAVHHAEKRFVRRDGQTVYARVSVAAIYDDVSELTELYAQIQDITDATLAARRVEEAQFETLARLAAVAEYRDDQTGGHTRRVGELSAQVARQLGLAEPVVHAMRMAAPLHDMGKIAIPDAILLKSGPLTDEEFTEMQRHTTMGAQMLSGTAFAPLALAADIALTHHERWDGTGYPRGLAGDAIPIAGRIVAAVDVFDALIHDRPYKRAWSREDALAELQREKGRQFDPQVVDALVGLEQDDGPAPPDGGAG